MAGSRTLKLNILADTKDLVDGLKKANGQVTGAQSGIAAAFDKVKVAAIAATAAGAAFAVKYGKDAILAASNLSETIAKAGEVFGDTSREVEKFAATAASSLGQSKQQALDAATTFAIFGKSAGLAGEDLVKFSTDFTVLASDLASFNNTSPDEAITAIGAALRGEAEPLRRFGVLLDDATLRSAALELGIISTTKNALTPQQKVLAAQEVIFRQTADAQGDFARTSDGLANSQRILAAQLDNVKTTIGTALLPIATELFANFSRKLIPAVEGFAKVFSEQLIPYLERRVFPAFAELKEAIFGIGDAFKSTTNDAKESNIVIETLEQTIKDFVPVTVGALTTVTNVWATFLDIISRGAAFISGDLERATAKFNNRFAETDKVTNNVSQSMVNAYKQFEFFNKESKDNTIPNASSIASGFNAVAAAGNAAAAGTRALTTAQREQSALAKELAALRAGGAIPAALSPDLKQFYKSELGLISGFGGFIEGINLLPDDPFFGFGKGGNVNQAIQQRQSGSARATGGTVNINVNGTVLDPEGTARAIQELIRDTEARGGDLFDTFVGINP
jgi:hypothetical protein